ncbi:MAG: porin family protein [Cyclobacteriaceae bacterium]
MFPTKSLFTLFFTLTTLLASSQPQKILSAFGIKGGFSLGNMGFVDAPTLVNPLQKGANTGFTGGLVFKHIGENSPHLGVQIELNASQRGWEEKDDSIGTTYTRELLYLDLPVMMHLAVFGNKKVNMIVNAGLNFGYLLSDKKTVNSEATFTRDYFDSDLNSKLDYGITGGIGINYNLKKRSIQAELRYYTALSDSFKPDTDFSESNQQVISFAFTYFFVKRY